MIEKTGAEFKEASIKHGIREWYIPDRYIKFKFFTCQDGDIVYKENGLKQDKCNWDAVAEFYNNVLASETYLDVLDFDYFWHFKEIDKIAVDVTDDKTTTENDEDDIFEYECSQNDEDVVAVVDAGIIRIDSFGNAIVYDVRTHKPIMILPDYNGSDVIDDTVVKIIIKRV